MFYNIEAFFFRSRLCQTRLIAQYWVKILSCLSTWILRKWKYREIAIPAVFIVCQLHICGVCADRNWYKLYVNVGEYGGVRFVPMSTIHFKWPYRLAVQLMAETMLIISFYYPRPVLAFVYCRCLRLCVCVCLSVCVCQSRVCPRDNSSPVQARITKFRAHMQNTLVKVLIVLWGDRPWPSRSNLT